MATTTGPCPSRPAEAAPCRTSVAVPAAVKVPDRQWPAILPPPVRTPKVQSTPPGPCQPCSAPLTLPRKSANGRVWRHHGQSPIPAHPLRSGSWVKGHRCVYDTQRLSKSLLILRFEEDFALTGMVGLADHALVFHPL